MNAPQPRKVLGSESVGVGVGVGDQDSMAHYAHKLIYVRLLELGRSTPAGEVHESNWVHPVGTCREAERIRFCRKLTRGKTI